MLLRVLFIASLIFGISLGDECQRSSSLIKGTGSITVEGIVTCGGKPLYGAYIQLVDNFQAVNDVVGHGHTDHNGGFKVYGQYYFYSDTDLAPARGSWNIVIYSYCGLGNHRKNQCHRVHKQTVADKDASNPNGKCLEMKQGGKPDEAADIAITDQTINLDTAQTDAVKKENICLDGTN